ncbi:DNA primase large subunit-like [Zophobas morio]|uniref:DNA primase large subunit-like n=1 Tax=Zophobas morio TaxID=2755281 RepID=UPI003082E88C
MQAIERRIKSKLSGKIVDLKRYPLRVQMYELPPSEEIDMEEFENLGWGRLKLLKAVENSKIRFAKSEEQKRSIEEACNKYFPLSHLYNANDEKVYEERRRDHISHFILKLAFCRSEELRRRFLTLETELFRFRLSNEDSESITSFLLHNNLYYNKILLEEKMALSKELKSVANKAFSRESFDATDIYKLRFEQAIDLVRGRRVFLKGGFAYVPKKDLITIVAAEFRQALSESLTLAAKSLPLLEENDRILPFLKTLGECDTSNDYRPKEVSSSITADDVNDLVKHFPLCMSHLHHCLRRDHHLKHWGRLQYRLFLKWIGLSVEEAIKFWKKELLRVMPLKKFEGEHLYGVRHTYGKEGKHLNYSAYSCHKIITTNPPASGDHHGCPFKHFDAINLRTLLLQGKISSVQVEEILKLVKEKHYQVACTRFFEAVHKVEHPSLTIIHPNQFYEESLAVKGLHSGTPFQSNSISAKET